MTKINILITGAAGFIGFHLCKSLLNDHKFNIFGIDNINSYYDTELKENRIKILKKNISFKFKKIDIINFKKLNNFTKINKIKIVIHLAAQAGVRHSFKNTDNYFDSNILGFYNILKITRDLKLKHLLYASTSSVYGESAIFPLKENFNTDQPESFYAATKKINEIMAYSFSKNFNCKISGMRFFTVYGPYGRPDMSYYSFTKKMINDENIDIYNYGNNTRDFTYVDDIIIYIKKLIFKPPLNKISFEIYNIGNKMPINIINMVNTLKKILKSNSKIILKPKQPGDVVKTHSSIIKIQSKLGKHKHTNLKKGLIEFVNWYKKYYVKK